MLSDVESSKKVVSKTLKDLDDDDDDEEEEDDDENENAMREMLTNEYLEGEIWDDKITEWSHYICLLNIEIGI